MITQYSVIASNDPDDLKAKMTAALKGGWQPQGGVAVDTLTDKKGTQLTVLYQAIVK
jgi:Domain of unknown function (DUF1737)